ncbi:MAG: mobile mystery protein B [Tepidisphaeraceae bacterium]
MTRFEVLDGETPLDDISGLIPANVKTRAQLNEVEADNIADVIAKYLGRGKPTKELAPFDFIWAFDLHREMFGKVWRWAGERRNTDLNLGLPVPQIDPALLMCLQDLDYWEKNNLYSVPKQATLLHHRAVRIHPFLNGNGRWSRMLANIWLYQHDQKVVFWPEKLIGTTSTERKTYLDAIRAADNGDLDPLFKMQEQYAEWIDDPDDA